MKQKRIESLERRQHKAKPQKEDILSGLDPFTDIMEQTDTGQHPRIVYDQIRAAQQRRIDSLDTNDFLGRYENDGVTLTTQEKNFVYVHEQDIKGGILRQTADETIERIRELLREQRND